MLLVYGDWSDWEIARLAYVRLRLGGVMLRSLDRNIQRDGRRRLLDLMQRLGVTSRFQVGATAARAGLLPYGALTGPWRRDALARVLGSSVVASLPAPQHQQRRPDEAGNPGIAAAEQPTQDV